MRSNSLEYIRQRSREILNASTGLVVDTTRRPFYRLHSHFFIDDLQKTAVKGAGGYFLISSSLCMLCRGSLVQKPPLKSIKIHPEVSLTSNSHKAQLKKRSRRCSLQHHHEILQKKPQRKGVLQQLQLAVKRIKTVFIYRAAKNAC